MKRPKKPKVKSQNRQPNQKQQEISCSDDTIRRIVDNLLKSRLFWLEIGIGILIAVILGCWGITSFVGSSVKTSIKDFESNTVSSLNVKLQSEIHTFEVNASNRLQKGDMMLLEIDASSSNQMVRLSNALAHLETNVNIRLLAENYEMTNRIVQSFQEPRISNTVSQVASIYARELIGKQIQPEVDKFKTDLDVFRNKADLDIKKLRDELAFSLTISKALGDDRKAFDELAKIQDNPNSPNREIAVKTIITIMRQLSEAAVNRRNAIDIWDGTTNNMTTATFENFVDRYYDSLASTRLHVIHQLFCQERFPLYKRISFLIDVMKKEESLVCLNQACFLLSQTKSDAKWSIIGVPLFIDWWEKNKEKMYQEMIDQKTPKQ